jgi:hypothetical protein
MSGNPARFGISNPAEPVFHELPPIRFRGDTVQVRISVRRGQDGVWRARLLFGPGDPEAALSTAEIFCGVNEADLWQSVRDLREHHVHDLYRSLKE